MTRHPGAKKRLTIHMRSYHVKDDGKWAAVGIFLDGEREIKRKHLTGRTAYSLTRIEIHAATTMLGFVKKRFPIDFYTVSTPLYEAATHRIARWRTGGWTNQHGEPVAERELWEKLAAEADRHDVTWHHLVPNSGNAWSDAAFFDARDTAGKMQ